MAKDPAFLFYPNDWLGGTLGFTHQEKGAYMDLLIFQFNRGSFTEQQAIQITQDKEVWNTLKEKFKMDGDKYFNPRLLEEKEKRQKFTESRRQSRLKSNEDNVRIYIVRDNVRLTYKIGSSSNPKRRYSELKNQQAPAIIEGKPNERNLTLVWYSDPVLRIEEGKLHNHFKDSRISGEWFNLTNQDLQYIFNNYKGTFEERTLKRTENENENEIVNDIVILKGGTGGNFKTELLSSEQILEVLCMQTRISRPQAEYLRDCFVLQAEATDEGHSNYSDYSKHFINWAKKNLHLLDATKAKSKIGAAHSNIEEALKIINRNKQP